MVQERMHTGQIKKYYKCCFLLFRSICHINSAVFRNINNNKNSIFNVKCFPIHRLELQSIHNLRIFRICQFIPQTRIINQTLAQPCWTRPKHLRVVSNDSSQLSRSAYGQLIYPLECQVRKRFQDKCLLDAVSKHSRGNANLITFMKF